MRILTRRLIALTLVFFLGVPTFGIARSVANVMPLHNQEGRNFCTAWSIHEKNALWATAGHCVAAALERGYTIFISGKPATIVFYGFDETRDIAVLHVEGVRAPAWALAGRAAAVGEDLSIVGHPYGLPVLVTTTGKMAARNVPIAKRPVSDILDITVAGGNSGSPVVRNGRIVGLLWGGFIDSPHSLSIPWESIVRDIGIYFE